MTSNNFLSTATSIAVFLIPLSQSSSATPVNQSADKNRVNYIAQSAVDHSYTLGEFPGLGNREDWNTAYQIIKNANELRNNDHLAEAIARATQAIRIYPYDANIYLNRATSYYKQGTKSENEGNLKEKDINLEAAIQDYRKSLESSRDWRIYTGMSKTLVHLGRLGDAIEATKNALYISSPSPPADQRGKIILLLNALNEKLAREKQ